ncbi:MAG: hypothetical protein AAFR90_05310, partial [Pseudomonadota bacterium]
WLSLCVNLLLQNGEMQFPRILNIDRPPDFASTIVAQQQCMTLSMAMLEQSRCCAITILKPFGC